MIGPPGSGLDLRMPRPAKRPAIGKSRRASTTRRRPFSPALFTKRGQAPSWRRNPVFKIIRKDIEGLNQSKVRRDRANDRDHRHAVSQRSCTCRLQPPQQGAGKRAIQFLERVLKRRLLPRTWCCSAALLNTPGGREVDTAGTSCAVERRFRPLTWQTARPRAPRPNSLRRVLAWSGPLLPHCAASPTLYVSCWPVRERG